jgi:L-galactose dehydrogenase
VSVATARIGVRGPEVSVVGFGCAGLPDMESTDAAVSLLHAAFDRGVTYVDTSAYYGLGESERRLGAALTSHRDGVVVATKGGRYGDRDFDFSPDRIRTSVLESMARLGTGYLDLYQLHDVEFGSRSTVEDAIAALVELRDDGLVGAIGVTGYKLNVLTGLIATGELDAVLSYCRGNAIDASLERELLPVAAAAGVGVINGGPLCMGLLSGRALPDWHPAPNLHRDAVARLAALLAERNADLADVALRFSFQLSGVASTLIGTRRLEGLEDAIAAAERPLDPELLDAVLDCRRTLALPPWRMGLPENEEPGAIASYDPARDAPLR